jgi:anti-sigma factor RsiW
MRKYEMNCEETNRLLEEAFGRERDTSRQLELEEHLSHCSACRSVAREWQEFRSFFRAAAPRYKAPSQLRAKVLAAMQLEKAKRDFPRWTQPWVYAAAVLVLALVLALTLLFPDNAKELSSLAVLDHSRSIAANHLVDVASADQRVVKPWFAAKLDFSPPLVDLPTSGFALLGGRVSVIQNRPVAAVVYKHRKEVVTLFCWPVSKNLVSDGDYLIDGYHVCTWSSTACNYIVVSERNGRGLNEFVDSFREHLQSNPY